VGSYAQHIVTTTPEEKFKRTASLTPKWNRKGAYITVFNFIGTFRTKLMTAKTEYFQHNTTGMMKIWESWRTLFYPDAL